GGARWRFPGPPWGGPRAPAPGSGTAGWGGRWAPAAGANWSFPPVRSAIETIWPAVTVTLLSVSVPAVGKVVIFTAARALAPLLLAASTGSVKPKSAAAKVYELSSRIVLLLSAPAG